MGAARVIKNLSSSCHLPINTIEFENALSKIWRVSRSAADGERGSTIGLAISGGVDSMALAVLCSHLQSHSPQPDTVDAKKNHSDGSLPRLKFQAFVVDHGMRLGSDEEAANVLSILKQRGIPTKVLKIEWPQSQDPSSASNFESLARKHRFRLLGKACKDAEINSLLLAHHEDDQAETITMRLTSGHRMAGLTGIKSKASIPECYGLYGIHESGGGDIRLNPTQPLEAFGDRPVPETGGIKIYRPLLGFSKIRLISTCQAEGMPWFEDHTNKNPTITKRNAIRHMFNNFSLPAALSKPRLLSLAREITKRAEMKSQLLRSCLTECRITSFDTGTGTLAVKFPDLNEYQNTPTWSHTGTGQLAAEILSRIIMLVTPKEKVELSSLHSAVAHLFPGLEAANGDKRTPKAFTVCGVLFQPNPTVSDAASLPSRHGSKSRNNQWFLSRQPYSSDVTKKPVFCFAPNGNVWSSWRLYDGRYWIRLQNWKTEDVILRPFNEKDKKELSNSVLWGSKGRLQNILKQRAPGNVRWTLPIITVLEKDGREKVLGLPSLGIGGTSQTVKWEVRYKKVYMEDLVIVN